MTTFVGRKNSTEILRDVLLGKIRSDDNLTIQSIVGPGGVGKTTLLKEVIAHGVLREKKYMVIWIDGGKNKKSTLDEIIRVIVNRAYKAEGKETLSHFFVKTTKALSVYDNIRRGFENEIRKLLDDDDAKLAGEMFDFIVSAGKKLNRWSPSSRGMVNFNKLEEDKPEVLETLDNLKCFAAKSYKVWEKLGVWTNTIRNRMISNVPDAFAVEIVRDLIDIIPKQKRRSQNTWSGKPSGVDRLLFVIDDYEHLRKTLEPFMVDSFLHHLRESRVNTTVIILCRDRIENTNPAWNQDFGHNTLERIELKPLNKDEMYELANAYGVNEPNELEQIWIDTEGFPYSVHLWLEERKAGGKSAAMLKRFYDRTTRWMKDHEKTWLNYCVFLERVNKETLKHVLPNPSDTEAALKWFMDEGSVRSQSSDVYRVSSFIGSRIREFLKITDPAFTKSAIRANESCPKE